MRGLEQIADGEGDLPTRAIGLARRGDPAAIFEQVHVGKEYNRLEEVEAGIEHSPDEVWTKYADPKRNPGRYWCYRCCARCQVRSSRSPRACRHGASARFVMSTRCPGRATGWR